MQLTNTNSPKTERFSPFWISNLLPITIVSISIPCRLVEYLKYFFCRRWFLNSSEVSFEIIYSIVYIQ